MLVRAKVKSCGCLKFRRSVEARERAQKADKRRSLKQELYSLRAALRIAQYNKRDEEIQGIISRISRVTSALNPTFLGANGERL